jgi:hypothetical protein
MKCIDKTCHSTGIIVKRFKAKRFMMKIFISVGLFKVAEEGEFTNAFFTRAVCLYFTLSYCVILGGDHDHIATFDYSEKLTITEFKSFDR